MNQTPYVSKLDSDSPLPLGVFPPEVDREELPVIVHPGVNVPESPWEERGGGSGGRGEGDNDGSSFRPRHGTVVVYVVVHILLVLALCDALKGAAEGKDNMLQKDNV